MGTVTGHCAGIDVSEDFLDVDLHPAGTEMRFPHDDQVTASLLALLRRHQIERSSFPLLGAGGEAWK